MAMVDLDDQSSGRKLWAVAGGAALVVAIVIAVAVSIVVFDGVRAGDASNAPAIEQGAALAINTRATPNLGDFVAFTRPSLDGVVIGRVVAGPGHAVAWTAGGRQIDGFPAPEPYLDDRSFGVERAPVEVPQAAVFVLTDDRNHDASRLMGLVPYDSIVGVVSWRIWPPSGVT
jgi:signal peptidase I